MLLDVGATKLKAASPTVFTGTKKLASVDIPGTTVKVVVMVSVKKFMEVACTAVMVEVPIPTMVIMLPAIVATSVFELVYVNAPGPLVVGGTNANAADPNVFSATLKFLRLGKLLVTTNGAAMIPDM